MTKKTHKYYPLPPEYGLEILRVEVGSTLHGTGLKGGEDHDEMGIFLERPESTLGLENFEHYQFRTQPEGKKSKPGDTDLICYSLRKWMRLALKGNPSVLLPLYAPEKKIILTDFDSLGVSLRDSKWIFASRQAGKAFLGYMQRQRARMEGRRGRAGRMRITPDGSVDWKYAMHMLRLGYQGIEYLETGNITLPVPGDVGDHLRKVRKGIVDIKDVLFEAELMEREMKRLMDTSPLPENPDFYAANALSIELHMIYWDTCNLV